MNQTHQEELLKAKGIVLREIDNLSKKADKMPNLLEKLVQSKSFQNIESRLGYQRVAEELTLIDRGDNGEAIYDAYLLGMRCLEQGEPFLYRGPLASLYILWLLGVTRIDPLTHGVRHETLLGTYYQPESITGLEIAVRPSFVSGLAHIIERKDHWNVVPLELLDEVKTFLNGHPDAQYLNGFPAVQERLLHGDPSILGLDSLPLNETLQPEFLTVSKVISMISADLSAIDGYTDLFPFYDRDSLLLYLLGRGYDREEAYDIMENARKGRRAEEAKLQGIPEEYRMKILASRFLCPRAYAAELSYCRLLLAIDR